MFLRLKQALSSLGLVGRQARCTLEAAGQKAAGRHDRELRTGRGGTTGICGEGCFAGEGRWCVQPGGRECARGRWLMSTCVCVSVCVCACCGYSSCQVLGIGKDVPAASYIAASVIAAGIGGYCTAEVLSLAESRACERAQFRACCAYLCRESGQEREFDTCRSRGMTRCGLNARDET